MKKTLMGAVGVVTALTVGMATAQAQDAMKTYKDRTVTILVGYGAGGTYGQTSLLISRHFGNFIILAILFPGILTSLSNICRALAASKQRTMPQKLCPRTVRTF